MHYVLCFLSLCATFEKQGRKKASHIVSCSYSFTCKKLAVLSQLTVLSFIIPGKCEKYPFCLSRYKSVTFKLRIYDFQFKH